MMKRALGCIAFFLATAIVGCSGDDSDAHAAGGATQGSSGSATSGAGGGDATGSGGGSVTGSGGSDVAGSGGGVGGSTGMGGAAGDGSSTGSETAGSAGSGSAGGSGGSAGAGGSGGNQGGGAPDGGGIAVAGWYEAEAKPPNILYGRAVVSHCSATCPSTAAIKPGDMCCSGGGQVNWIVSGGKGPDPQPPDGRGGGELRFNAISAPADGMYDVTWWYHCGNNDNFGDKNCGGQTDPPTLPAGCRPHQIIVNGTEMPGTYHFPCFGGSWGIIRAATTTLPLKAGAENWIHVYAHKPRDAADMDALQISPVGKGTPPLIKSNSDPIGH
jgi:hypothetical protein